MPNIEFRTGGEDAKSRDAHSKAHGIVCPEKSLALQSQAEEADINTIVRRFGLTGELPTNVRIPLEGDFSDSVSDYRTALDLVREADAGFMRMPAEVRARFGNDAGAFVEFASDPKNLEECRKLGLAPPAPAQGAPAGAAPAGSGAA